MSDSTPPDPEQLAYEARLQRRMAILKQQFEADKIRINQGLQVIESLKNVRYAKDGTVDLSTVDGLVRSMALAVESMHDREEMKKTKSLAEIQVMYFEFLEKNFGDFFEAMGERQLGPHDVAMSVSRNREVVANLVSSLPGFLDAIEQFWQALGEVAHAHVEDMSEALKGVFGGDLFPSSAENIASKCGLYTDTLILPDPFLRSKHVFEHVNDEKKAYYLVKHGLNLLQYQTLACADLNPPVVAILPDFSTVDKSEQEWFHSLGKEDTVLHAAHLFGRNFSSFDELLDFSSSLGTVDSVVTNISDKSRLLFDTAWEGSVAEQITRAASDPIYASMFGSTQPGTLVALQALGRMSVSNELLVKARRLRGTPIIDAPTSWQFFVWKLEYDAQHVEAAEGIPDLHVVRGLQTLAENEMQWLGNIPPSALIELRKTGALEEVRGILNKGINELSLANPLNFHRTSDRIFDNIHLAFSAHQKNIDALSTKKWTFAGSDIGSWLVVGSLAVTAAATGAPVWGLAALAADQLLPAPKLKDIPKSIRNLAEESSKLKRSPVGMLFRLSK